MVRLHNTVWEDLKCALHSHIPWCCVLYYSLVYRPLYSSKKYRLRYRQLVEAYGANLSYVACTSCLRKNNIIEPKQCKCFYKKFKLGYLAYTPYKKFTKPTSDLYVFYTKYGRIEKEVARTPLW